MTTIRNLQHGFKGEKNRSGERGSALVIALFVLALISVFVALALSRTAAEAAAVGNETAEARTIYAAQGSLEMMTRNFNKIFERKLNPSTTDLNAVRTGAVPGLQPQFTFFQELDKIEDNGAKVLTGGPYTGLYSLRDTWRLRTTATDSNGSQIRLTRNVLNNRIPIFQFGIFYNDDLELFRPPRFSFGGRVHSNGNFFISPGTEGVYFNSRVTAAQHIVTQTWRNGYTGDSGNNQTFIKNASGVDKQLLPDRGSVINGTPNVFASNPDMPSSKLNPSWTSQSAIFDGNLQANVRPLKLPLSVGAPTDLIEMIKRGNELGNLLDNANPVAPVDVDTTILRAERFANKTGIRISLADSKAKLPGCATGVGTAAVTAQCGVRLDGNASGDGSDRTAMPTLPLPGPTPTVAPNVLTNAVRGYQPKPMRTTVGGAFDYTPTRLNGERLFSGNQVWIKIETVNINDATGLVDTRDITQDILALGVTEQAPTSISMSGYNTAPLTNSLTATTAQSVSGGGTDSRSIIKIQRFVIPGPAIPGGNNVLVSYGSGSTAATVVRRWSSATAAGIAGGCATGCTTVRNTVPDATIQNREHYAHMKLATVNGVANEAIVPFPIQMFDTREGEHYDDRSNTYYTDINRLTRNGIMSMIDIDVANLRRFFRGDFNGLFPTDTPFALSNANVGLTSNDIPQRAGWVFYIADRRGDADFDGEFDMEDVYGANLGNDGVMQLGEDANKNGLFENSYGTEAERFNTNTIFPDLAAVNDHKYYRRGIRLINGTTIPGIYDSATQANTRGFTVATENGIYVKGNYNATGVAVVPATGNTPFDQYLPFNTPVHIPASIVADAVTILSNGWNDAQSFSSPYDESESYRHDNANAICDDLRRYDRNKRRDAKSGRDLAAFERRCSQFQAVPRAVDG